ncbi:MAG: GNAT family N-acetyltransferase [Candidatus Hodarchaeota archaeon]
MIIILTEDKVDEVKDLLDEYVSFLVTEYKLKKSEAQKIINNNLKDENNTYYVYLSDSTPLGLVGVRKEQSLETEAYITRIFVSDKVTDDSIEIKLFKKVFQELSSKLSTIRIMGYQPSTKLQRILAKYNFQPFERHFMSIPRKTVEALPEPDLPDGFHFDTWNEELNHVGIEIMTDAHIGSVDNLIFSFFRNQKTGMAFMQNLESHRWGKFKPSNTSILKHDGTPIGVCFMTVLNQNGYIPDFVLKMDFKGKGLGKKLFVRSLKWFLQQEPESQAIDLDVTKKNTIALNIYKNTGFEIKRTYSVYTWNKDES